MNTKDLILLADSPKATDVRVRFDRKLVKIGAAGENAEDLLPCC